MSYFNFQIYKKYILFNAINTNYIIIRVALVLQ